MPYLGVPAFVYDDHRILQRYTVGPIWTLGVLIRERPDVVYSHFSFILQLMILVYKYVYRFGRVVIVSDCHNKALKRCINGPLSWLFLRFKKFVFYGTNMIIVTNASLVCVAKQYCTSVAILRDPLTDWGGNDELARENRLTTDSDYVFFICSFDKDEPAALIFDSANAITEELGCRVIISGRIPNEEVPEAINSNDGVVLPGFMPIDEYRKTLFMASTVVVLTEDEDCLVCGAYESIGASRPTVLSATSSLKSCFQQAAYYTNHETEDIVTAVGQALNTPVGSGDSLKAFGEAWLAEWEIFKNALKIVLK